MKNLVAFVERWARAARRLAYRYFAAMLRFAESCLPVPILVLFLFPAAAVTATCELVMGKRHSTFRQLHHLSESARLAGAQWRRRSFAQVWIGRVAMCLVRFLRFWPDRLSEQRWRRRCQYIGLERVKAILAKGRPVVLATLHYGNLTELYHCIRSCGIGIAFLTARRDSALPYRIQLDSWADCANGLEGVPRRIEIGHLNLSQVPGFLAHSNRVLAIPIEGRTKSDIMIRGPGYFLRAAPGALQLAGMTGAVVIPCLFSAEKYLRSIIRFGEPLADDVVSQRDRHPLGYENILQQIGPWIAKKPEQCAPQLIVSLSFRQPPVHDDRVAEAAAKSVDS